MASGVALEAKGSRYDNLYKEKIRDTDRILVLEKIEGDVVKTNTGLIDNRLFKGGNKLHAAFDDQSLLWGFRYESGTLPEPLRGKFTSFKKLKDFADGYFSRRGLKIVQVID